MAVPSERSRPLALRSMFRWFARPAVQLLIFVSFTCLESYNAANRASQGDFGAEFWFFTVAAMFFMVMAALSLWQHKEIRTARQ